MPLQINTLLAEKMTDPINQKYKMSSILLRPQIFLKDIIGHIDSVRYFFIDNDLFQDEIIEEAEIKIKYESYIIKEQALADKMSHLEYLSLAGVTDYSKITSLSYEAREKLSKVKPETIGQASRISGVSPADISVLIVYIGR